MYIAMNRFTVNETQKDTFEKVWSERERKLHLFEGFLDFKMLKSKGDPKDGKRLYVSHATWKNEESFMAWVQSAEFKESHGKNKMPEGVMAGPPQFEGLEVILES